MQKFLAYISIIIILITAACDSSNPTLFKLISPSKSGIKFRNDIFENDEYNILRFSYLYNGGGVSIGDFDNNGLPDIFFTGNMVDNALYLNQGNMKFKNITDIAGVASPDQWIYGSAVVDINNDGLLDIYACASILGAEDARRNSLFVNQGLNDDGIPVFKDEAKQYGIDDSGHSSHAAFLDYDNDGDLDLFILSNSKVEGIPSVYKAKVNDGTSDNTDRLYRNNGDGTFSDVSDESGILNEGFGLGIAVMDVDKDGAPDVYVGNDYLTNDLLYLNDGAGNFTNKIDDVIEHQSRFSMGNDAADINNDGHLDIITLDMLPETNLRKKTVIVANGYIVYINDNKFGYTHQHVRNMLQLNNGNMSFSEIGQLAGVHQTEWSWAPLFADIDNDGLKDLLITNGFPKDITDNDFISFRQEAGAFASLEQLMEQIPSVKIPNYAFKNNGDLTFADVSTDWGFTQPSFSNGAAFADFDLDGDLDYVVNNINDPAFLYENTTINPKNEQSHYLRVKLKGSSQNALGLGAKLTLHYGNGKTQYHEQSIYRGYVSTVEDIVHFGLGEYTEIDKLEIIWPDGKESILENVPADQVLEVSYENSRAPAPKSEVSSKSLVTDISDQLGIDFTHEEKDFIDYNIQRNIPHKFSQFGPAISVGDINGDELEDMVIGSSREFEGSLFFQQPDGTFRNATLAESKDYEDMGMLLFDADNDNDLDLYLVSGSFEFAEGTARLQDRLMLNDGRGNFTLSENALPEVNANGSCVRAADYDADGDLDLFVGGRVVAGAYPQAPKSYILKNDGGTFTDATSSVCADLINLGMVTDAIWSDYNGDGAVDLIAVGEFMPITFFVNENGTLVKQNETGISHLSGWWNSITAGDFDQDGDIDYIAGNVGENNFYCATPETPVRITAKDFDQNGALDAILSCYLKADDGSMQLFPVHSWPELNAQSPIFRGRFEKYEEYGRTTTDGLFSEEELEGALVLEATHFATSYIENLGEGKFSIKKLPVEAQFAPVNGILSTDVNRDGLLDIVMIGNDYGNEVNMGQYDAFIGLVLVGNGKGEFEALTARESGFLVRGDAKALVKLNAANGEELIIATKNRGPLRIFQATATPQQKIDLKPLDFRADITLNDGKIQKVEFPYGAGFLSQSSRIMNIGTDVKEVVVYDFQGNSRKVWPLDS